MTRWLGKQQGVKINGEDFLGLVEFDHFGFGLMYSQLSAAVSSTDEGDTRTWIFPGMSIATRTELTIYAKSFAKQAMESEW